jgi:23S rRNA (cytosine1962-C5)-methyltransferase
MAGLVVKPRARILHGHDWVYGSEVLKTFGQPEDGTVISIKDGRDRLLGTAIYNSRSQIIARRISRRRESLDADLFRRRIARAVAWRERAGCDPMLCRLVWSEADGLPGVIADRYGAVIVLQTQTLAMDLCREDIAAALAGIPGIECIVERNDSPARKAEGLEARTGILAGSNPGTQIVSLAGAKFEVDFLAGHKTGLYLDQSENYALAAGYARGARVLDCFANHGGFALACGVSGAREVVAVESGNTAVERMERNAALNSVRIEIRQEDVFETLPAMKGREFDLIILDPPSFTKAKGRVHDAVRGYRELHRLAAPLLAPDGILATFCCSHHVGEQEFLEAVAAGFSDARRSATIIAATGQPPDHPIALHLPESHYLKGLILASRAAF